MGTQSEHRLACRALGNERKVTVYASSSYHLQICTIPSGADGIRTHALRRAKAGGRILVRSSASGYSAILQTFCGIALSGLYAAYRTVPVRLQ